MWGTRKRNNYRHIKTLLRPPTAVTIPTHQLRTHRHKGYGHATSLVRCPIPPLLLEDLPQQAKIWRFNKPSVSCFWHYLTACSGSGYWGLSKKHWDESFYPPWLSHALIRSPVKSYVRQVLTSLSSQEIVARPGWTIWARSCLGLCCAAARSYQSQGLVAQVPGNCFHASPWSPWPSPISRTFPPTRSSLSFWREHLFPFRKPSVLAPLLFLGALTPRFPPSKLTGDPGMCHFCLVQVLSKLKSSPYCCI